MKAEWLGCRRWEWVAYLRAVSVQSARKRRDDGMALESGIIPFGAVNHWQSVKADKQAAALQAVPLARLVQVDAAGLALVVPCPYCGAEHWHWVTEDWDPEEKLAADCGQGTYRVRLDQDWHDLCREA